MATAKPWRCWPGRTGCGGQTGMLVAQEFLVAELGAERGCGHGRFPALGRAPPPRPVALAVVGYLKQSPGGGARGGML
jgi:hypothetical protein